MANKRGPTLTRFVLTHTFLLFCSAVVLFPVSRAITISFKDTDTFNPASRDAFPAPGKATAGDYLRFFANILLPMDAVNNSSTDGEKGKIDVSENLGLQPSGIVHKENSDDFDEFDALDRADESKTSDFKWYTNYYKLFTEYAFIQWAFNSLIVSLTAAFLGLLLASTSAYALSRFHFPGKKIASGFILATQMIPGPMLIIPIYLVIKSVGLGNTYAGYILALTVGTLPFSILILRGYFDTIPRSLEEAAQVDGCNQLSVFFKILIPLSTPALAIAFLFNFIASWAEFILASTLLDDVNLRTWPLGLMAFANNFDSRWGIMTAACVVIAIPSMMMFLYSAKYMITGMTLGASKG